MRVRTSKWHFSYTKYKYFEWDTSVTIQACEEICRWFTSFEIYVLCIHRCQHTGKLTVFKNAKKKFVLGDVNGQSSGRQHSLMKSVWDSPSSLDHRQTTVPCMISLSRMKIFASWIRLLSLRYVIRFLLQVWMCRYVEHPARFHSCQLVAISCVMIQCPPGRNHLNQHDRVAYDIAYHSGQNTYR